MSLLRVKRVIKSQKQTGITSWWPVSIDNLTVSPRLPTEIVFLILEWQFAKIFLGHAVVMLLCA